MKKLLSYLYALNPQIYTIIVPKIIDGILIELKVELKKQNVGIKFNFLVIFLYLCMIILMTIKPK